jgi:hypothetical protein
MSGKFWYFTLKVKEGDSEFADEYRSETFDNFKECFKFYVKVHCKLLNYTDGKIVVNIHEDDAMKLLENEGKEGIRYCINPEIKSNITYGEFDKKIDDINKE